MKDYYTFQNVKVHADESTVTVRPNDGPLRRLPLDQISGIHLLAGYSLTDGLINLSMRARFPVHFYSYGGHYQGSVNPRPAAPQAAMLIAQLDSLRDPSRRLEIAVSIAREHRRLLIGTLENAGVEVSLPELIEDTVESLMLSEARLRKEYYAHLDTCLEPFWSILKRSRKPPRSPADAVLGFCNGITYAKTTGWIYRSGLDPRIGYIHGETRAPNPLALDLADLVKPHLSDSILIALSESGVERSLIEEVGEGVYLNEKGRKQVIQLIEDKLRKPVAQADELWATSYETAFRQVPTKLHRAITTGMPIRWPNIPCT